MAPTTAGATVTLEAGRHEVRITRAGKELFPAGPGGALAVTKADLAAYHRDIAEYALPHLARRPLMLEIHPDGIGGQRFMQKNVPGHYPDWIHRAELPKEGGTVTQVLADSAETLVYLAGQGCTTLHRWLSRADKPRRPDLMVFDLDPSQPPGEKADFTPVRQAARRLGELLDDLGLPWAPMTTGSRGLHLVVPLARRADADEVRDFAREVADHLAARHPRELTTEIRKDARGGRLFLDVMRNGYAQTAVAPYAVRALPGAPVAVPVSPDALDDPALTADHWTLRTALDQARTSPWAHLADASPRTLGPARRKLRALAE
ncbi:non-homologous end-joining DNA ligase [Actinacidiphila guanduensis]|uniref:Bifunctional non-homologous end joining protein LigD n=1 Tax=Actinacidiphila guanduensis TaxID=310781 RepID=A0A1H0K2B7_9ACTN|nr:non-homologous end-joining DNA ligase [Actinacidiphila guanduensis]SDO50004.1 bifunctional non-homologous end joining protein LigD [Actinacidiphila guanduensis]